MIRKNIIRKGFIIGACLLATGGVASLLIAANRKEATRYCKGIDVTVQGAGNQAYITKTEILAQLQKRSNGIISKRIETIDVAGLEQTLENHDWIGDAELYFDTHDVLHVTVSERVPLARVYAGTGASFFLDSAGERLPLLAHVAIRVPLVTGFTTAKKWRTRDSTVADGVAAIATYIAANPFWAAQIAQIDITPAGTFELLPVVGNHIIRLGDAENIDQKLSNLLIFYKQVLRNTGFDKYAVVDVRFEDQVIGSHEKTISAIDSVKLQRNIQELIKRTRQQAEADSIAVIQQYKAAVLDSTQRADSLAAIMRRLNEEKPAVLLLKPVTNVKPKSKPVKNTTNTVKKPATQQPPPKAVMPKRNTL